MEYYNDAINFLDKKDDLIEAIDKVKDNNPTLTRLLLYIKF